MTTAADDNRILIEASIGQVQAWKPTGDDASVCFNINGGIKHKGNSRAWVSHTLFMSAAEARDLAVVLTQAADHVEALTVVELEDAI